MDLPGDTSMVASEAGQCAHVRADLFVDEVDVLAHDLVELFLGKLAHCDGVP